MWITFYDQVYMETQILTQISFHKDELCLTTNFLTCSISVAPAGGGSFRRRSYLRTVSSGKVTFIITLQPNETVVKICRALFSWKLNDKEIIEVKECGVFYYKLNNNFNGTHFLGTC